MKATYYLTAMLIACVLSSCSKNDSDIIHNHEIIGKYEGTMVVKHNPDMVIEKPVSLELMNSYRYSYLLLDNVEDDQPFKSGSYTIKNNTISFQPDYYPGMELMNFVPVFLRNDYEFKLANGVLMLLKQQESYPEYSGYTLTRLN